MEYLLYFSLLE